MHSSGAGIVPCCNELLRILWCVCLLVVQLFEGASEGRVAILNIKATQERTHIPIIVPFVHIGKVQVVSLLLHYQGSNAAPIRDNLARRCWHDSRGLHVVHEWSRTLSTPASSVVATATTSLTSRVKITCRKCLLHGDGHLLYGRHLECVPWHKPACLLTGASENDSAAICNIMAVLFADSWLIAAAISALPAGLAVGVV